MHDPFFNIIIFNEYLLNYYFSYNFLKTFRVHLLFTEKNPSRYLPADHSYCGPPHSVSHLSLKVRNTPGKLTFLGAHQNGATLHLNPLLQPIRVLYFVHRLI